MNLMAGLYECLKENRSKEFKVEKSEGGREGERRKKLARRCRLCWYSPL